MARSTPHRLLMLRSGRTEWDLLGRVQGATDLPMADQGRQMVEQNLQAIGNQKLDLVLTAPDEASRLTAKMLAEATGARKVSVMPELADMGLGLWEGLRYEELESRFCRAGRLFMDDPSGVMAPEGEVLEAYAARVVSAMAKAVARKKASAIGVVLRPLALGVARCTLNGASICELWEMIRERPEHEWYLVESNDPRLGAPPRRPRHPASAA